MVSNLAQLLCFTCCNICVGRMQEVQGHIAKTDIDPGASPAWLAIESDLLCSTPGSGVALKRVFKPFDWNLRIYNSAAIANATPNGGASGPLVVDHEAALSAICHRRCCRPAAVS